MKRRGQIPEIPVRDYVAAVSVGIIGEQALLDLEYEEDSRADVDMNVVMTGAGSFIELQGTAEHAPFTRDQHDAMTSLAKAGIDRIRLSEGCCGRPDVMIIVFATKNEGKVREIREMLAAEDIELCSLNAFAQAPDIVEDGKTYLENALKKAKIISEFTGETVLADDSGLEVDVLGGEPGVYSARYAGEGRTDEENKPNCWAV
jgi:XTP/dITP diphosphohydrolase